MPWRNGNIDTSEKKPVQREGLHSIALEPHYSVPQVAAMWHVSEKTVRRLFEDEAGVLRWGTEDSLHKRGYQNLRIPQSILIRVHQRRETA
jgi:AraC-like DNA-binding protein